MQHLDPVTILPQCADQEHIYEKTLLDSINQFNVPEKRLLLLAIEEAREMLSHNVVCSITVDHYIAVKASKYMEAFGGDIQSAYSELCFACGEIYEKVLNYPFFSKLGRLQTLNSRWVNEICYHESEPLIYLVLPPYIIKKLDWLEDKLSSNLIC